MLGKKQGKTGWDWGEALSSPAKDCFIFNENYITIISQRFAGIRSAPLCTREVEHAFGSQRHFSTNQCPLRAACFSVCRVRGRKKGEKQPVGVRPDQSGIPRCGDQNLRRRPGGLQGSHPGGTSRGSEWAGRIGARVGKAGAAAKRVAGAKRAEGTASTRGECGCLSLIYKKTGNCKRGAILRNRPPFWF